MIIIITVKNVNPTIKLNEIIPHQIEITYNNTKKLYKVQIVEYFISIPVETSCPTETIPHKSGQCNPKEDASEHTTFKTPRSSTDQIYIARADNQKDYTLFLYHELYNQNHNACVHESTNLVSIP